MVLKEVKRISAQDPKSLLERMVKLQEETGELAEQILIYLKASGTQHKKLGEDGIKGECIDVMLCALDIFFSQGGSIEEFNEKLHAKSQKWEKYQLKTKSDG